MICSEVFSQSVGALKGQLKNSNDSTRAGIYKLLGDTYFSNQLDSSIYFYSMAIAYAKRSDQHMIWANCLGKSGLAQEEKGEFKKATIYLQQALAKSDSLGFKPIEEGKWYLALARSITSENPLKATLEAKKGLETYKSQSDIKGQIESYNLLGSIYGIRKNNPSAIENYSYAIELARSLNDNQLVGENLINTAELYVIENNIPKALEYFYQAIDIGDNIKDVALASSAKLQVGNIYMNQGKYQQAISLFTTVLNYHSSTGNIKGQMDLDYLIGLGHKQKGDYQSALLYYFRSFELAKKLGDNKMMAKIYNERAICYLNQNKLSLASKNADWALDIAKKKRLTEQLMHASLTYSDINVRLRKFGPALNHYKNYTSYRDRLYTKNKADELNAIEQEYKNREQELEKIYEEKEKASQLIVENTEKRGELAVKQKDVEVFQLNAKNDKLKNNTLIGSMILLLLFSLGTIIAYKNKLDDNKILITQKDEIVRQKDDLLKKNKRLIELNNEKDSLVNMVAHDLRSPLDQIKGLVSVINMNTSVAKKNQEYLDMISFAADRMRGLIGRTLNIRNIDKQEIDPKNEIFDVSKTVDDILTNFVELANRKNLTIHSELQRNGCFVKADINFITQILENLISNAIKFSPRGKSIRIKVGKINDMVKIEVIDQGPGIRKEDMDRLFKKFQRLSARPTGDEDSTGLGLSIVKRFVDAMGGKVSCESTFGEGANFIVEFESVDSSNA